MTNMKIELMVRINGWHFSGSVIAVVPELQLECFEPLKTTTDLTFAYVNRELPVEDMEVKRVMKTRKDAAAILAKELAAMIVHEMEKNDTHNGYPNKET